MPCCKRRREHDAVGHRRRYLERALPRIVVTVGCQNSPAFFHGVFRHEIDGATQARYTELRWYIVLVDLNLFHLVQVYRRQIHRATTSVVQGHAVYTNQNVSGRNSTNRNGLKTPQPTLLVRLDSW